MGRARLDVDADPSTWLIGPTEDRPYDRWLPAAVDVVCEDFEVEDAEGRDYVTQVLQVFGRDDDHPLTERLLRWRAVEDAPLPVRFGMVTRESWPAEDVEAYLRAEDLLVVEAPVVEAVEDVPDGRSVRRSLSYSLLDDELVVSLRYVVESPSSPSLLAVVHTASTHPNLMVEAVSDLDLLCRTLHARGSA
ncbi:hypothetical protein HMPREF0063_12295 [Aeromicrobium marinum DSM 15272]|uniref:Uncharacterized protein n=1 Tax=Aeromicrobium marinum DSM 15272 TaxID=585531 RepID=E2SCY3_9ACTN|nr:hypothetical protein [Aeromicrobium marinum]EFQ83086.1 hypothetical protein HMPREF0063_12295 [Aeromicrobium marinum DSM 15272]